MAINYEYLGNIRGPRGYSVDTATVDTDGHLHLYLTDGTAVDAGVVRGPQGLPGVNALENDDAVAAYVAGPSSTRDALSAGFISRGELTLNVKDFGAKGDGATDDTAALQSAIQNGGRIFFPAGTYVISNYLVLAADTVIDGYGATIKRADTGDAYFKVFMNGPKGDLTSTGYDGRGNIHVRGLTVDLNGFVNPVKNEDDTVKIDATMSAFDMGHGSDLSFVDVTVKNGQNGHYYQISGCENVVFERCQFLDQNWTNTASSEYESLQIEPLTSSSFPTFGAYDDTPSRNITVRDCLFSGVVRALGTHSYPSDDGGTTVSVWVPGVTIEGCTIRNTYDHGITLTGFSNVRVAGCVLDTIGDYGIVIDHCQNVVIESTFISETQKVGISASSTSGLHIINTTLTDTVVSFSTDPSMQYTAFRISACTDTILTNPVVVGAGAWHNYAYYESTCTGTVIDNPKFDVGHATANAGWIGSDSYTLKLTSKDQTLFNGDLSTIATAQALAMDIRLFNKIMVMVNDNGSATAQVVAVVIPRSALVNGSPASRYRAIIAAANAAEFSFPSSTTVRLDVVTTGTGHVRQVIGVS